LGDAYPGFNSQPLGGGGWQHNRLCPELQLAAPLFSVKVKAPLLVKPVAVQEDSRCGTGEIKGGALAAGPWEGLVDTQLLVPVCRCLPVASLGGWIRKLGWLMPS
jgi:hypothetical protein